MAAPTSPADGVVAAVTTGSVTVTLAAHQANDILVIELSYWGPNTAGDAAQIPTPAGWTALGNQIGQPAASPRDGWLAWFWKRAASSAETNPVCSPGAGWDTGTDTCFHGRAWTIRNCITSGNPYDSVSEAGPYTTANQNFPVVTVPNIQRSAWVFCSMHDDAGLGAAPSGWTADGGSTTTTGTDGSAKGFRKINVSSDTAADASAVVAPVQGAYGFKGVSFRPASLDVAVGVVSETDAAQAVVGSKRLAVGTVSETDAAQLLGRSKRRAVSVASEADAAQVITRGAVTHAVGVASETDAALALSHRKQRAVGTVSETDAALALAHRKQRAVGVVSETDSALAVARSKRRAVGLVSETDAALALGRRKQRAVGTVSETDEAQAINRFGFHGAAVGTAIETDQALALGRRKRRTVGVASETDAALALSHRKRLAVGIVTEIDLAGDIFEQSGIPAPLTGQPTYHVAPETLTGHAPIERVYGGDEPGDRGMTVVGTPPSTALAPPAPVMNAEAEEHGYAPVDAEGQRGQIIDEPQLGMGFEVPAVVAQPSGKYDVAVYDVDTYVI